MKKFSINIKNILIYILGNPIVFLFTFRILKMKYYPYVRCINYHDTPIVDKEKFENQLIWFKRYFSNCTKKDLSELLNSGIWNKKKPGILFTFDDGLLSNFEMAAPLLEKHGFTAFFMVPAIFPDLSIKEQHAFAQNKKIIHSQKDLNKPLAMTYNQINELLNRGHSISCHTMNHEWLKSNLTNEELNIEIIESKKIIEDRLGIVVSDFTWVGGNEFSYSKKAFKKIIKAGYSHVFCTNSMVIHRETNPFFLERSNIEVNFSLNRIRLILGGLYDIFYFRKRKHVIKKLTH